MKTYQPIDITKNVTTDPARYGFAYRREVDLGAGEIISAIHRAAAAIPDTDEGRAAQYTIAADGTTKTGAEILADFGLS